MPIELITGKPGSGKSLSVVERLRKLRADGQTRPVFVQGVDGIDPALATVIDARQVERWQELPTGSLIFVDECQKLMPARRATADAPGWVRALSEHRHAGVDFVLTTQHPSLIDPYVRRLVAMHEHFNRMFGSQTVQVYRWSEVQADPDGKAARKAAELKRYWRFPTSAFGSYKSAELHTIKRRLPRWVYVAVVVALAVPALGGGAMLVMRHLSRPERVAPVAAGSGTGVVAAAGGLSGYAAGSGRAPATLEEWARARTPRVAGAPWSAPVYDGLAMATVPDVRCIKVEDDCRCYTEQDTRDRGVPDGLCRVYVRDGVYNPVRPVVAPSVAPVASDQSQSGQSAAPLAARGVGAGFPPSAIPQDFTEPERTAARSRVGTGGS